MTRQAATYHASDGVEESLFAGSSLMPERRPAVPGLYSIDGGDPPSLEGRRCLSCGYVFFPPHAFGCEVCGALPERTEPMRLAGEGVLRSFAAVHRHGGETPLTVGEIGLDAGPTVRAALTGQGELAIGDRMRAVLWTAPAAGAQDEAVVELRFERAPGTADKTGTAAAPGATR
jgi:uncharacterized protein